MKFEVNLIKTPESNQFLKAACSHVTGEYWIYEGELDCLDFDYTLIAIGECPSIGSLSESEMIAGCEKWFGWACKVKH